MTVIVKQGCICQIVTGGSEFRLAMTDRATIAGMEVAKLVPYELYDLRLFRIELETVDLQPRVNSGHAILELTNANRQVGLSLIHI